MWMFFTPRTRLFPWWDPGRTYSSGAAHQTSYFAWKPVPVLHWMVCVLLSFLRDCKECKTEKVLFYPVICVVLCAESLFFSILFSLGALFGRASYCFCFLLLLTSPWTVRQAKTIDLIIDIDLKKKMHSLF